jgi:NADPH:quinone reductase-like Zn-dependent oxidoreductase
MRHIVIHRPGSYHRLRVEEASDPRPGPGQVRVRVAAAGVNYADCVTRMGLYASARQYVGFPITPGFEFSGQVAEVGPGVQALEPGAEVFGVTRFGGYASEVVVDQGQVFPIAQRLSLVEAAGFPAVFLTAWYALFELAHPHPGDRVLVHSAAGGVGSSLVQLGRIAGAHVIGVVGASHKVQPALDLGAAEVIDKSRQDLWSEAERLAPGGYDVVLDANGVSTLRQSYRHLAPAGKLVVYGFHSMLPRRGGRPNWLRLARDALRTPRFNPLRMTTRNRSVLAFNLSFLFDRADLLAGGMDQLLRWMSEGKICMPPVTTFAFEDVADAHRALESGQTVGKLVLTLK